MILFAMAVPLALLRERRRHGWNVGTWDRAGGSYRWYD
jgi:hypothetical protein